MNILYETYKTSFKSRNILRKTIEGYYNSFDYITFEKIISKHIIFVSDRTTNMKFSKMQNKIYGSLVSMQYHTKCTNPLYSKFTSKQFSLYLFFAATFIKSLLMFKFRPQTSAHTHWSVIAPYNVTTSSTKMQIVHTPGNMTTNWE